ncbi:MAG: hypothetical protein NTX76_06180 [Alphaproteobacteria bacterium]|nr:hypothetical protein [Alphaproteobacteria bacterium]
MIELKKIHPTFIVGFSFLLIIGFYFFIEQILRPVGGDAPSYMEIARAYNSKSIVAAQTDSHRTFAYPWILSLLIKLSGIANFPDILLIFVFQTTAYLFATLLIVSSVSNHSSKLASILFVALCFNIYVIPYHGITLTDSLYTSISIMIFGILIRLECLSAPGNNDLVKWIFYLIFLLSWGIVIRPAAIWLSVPVFYCIVRLFTKGYVKITDLILVLITGAVPLYIQICLNVLNYKVISFLPAANLGGMQIQWGIENVKYGTWMGNGGIGNYYSSKSIIGTVTDPSIRWYFGNPSKAIRLLSLKMVGAFDFDYLMPYPYRKLALGWIPSFLSFSILWFGSLGVVFHLFTGKLRALGSRFMPLIIFLSWSSVALISALELRFTLPLLSYFIVVGSVFIFYLLNGSKKWICISFMGCIISMPIFYITAKFIRSLSSVIS